MENNEQINQKMALKVDLLINRINSKPMNRENPWSKASTNKTYSYKLTGTLNDPVFKIKIKNKKKLLKREAVQKYQQ